ncbi:hypothetical protein GCK32_000498 [Trichostrongylus colubriformis]|uniref:Uncharacterized protein n=1 Tax=Trichostrongylus colubriformis TaxID=6319 RepID=A0AAN8F111_TRICO
MNSENLLVPQMVHRLQMRFVHELVKSCRGTCALFFWPRLQRHCVIRKTSKQRDRTTREKRSRTIDKEA